VHVVFTSDDTSPNSGALGQSLDDFAFRDFPTIQDSPEETQATDSTSWSAEVVTDVVAQIPVGHGSRQQLKNDLSDKLDFSSGNKESPLSNFGFQPDDFNWLGASSTLPAETVGNSSSGTELRRLRLFNSSSTSLLGQDALPQILEELPGDFGQSSSNDDWKLPNSTPIQCMHLGVPPFQSSCTIPISTSFVTSSIGNLSATGDCSELNQFNVEPTPLIIEPTFTSWDLPLIQNTAMKHQPDTECPLSIDRRSSQGSYLSITSLNRRLSFKYSESSLEDINSLMEHFTLSGSTLSLVSNTNPSCRSSRMSSNSPSQSRASRSLSTIIQQPILPVKAKPPVILPGTFHTFCWDDIMCLNTLGHCRRDGLLCQHDRPSRTFFLSKVITKTIIYSRIKSSDINEVDIFGNSVLHVAASLGSPVRYLIELITKNNVNTNATNSAGQTFLHLVYAPTEYNDICLLLGILSVRGFNFGQHDHHGQTSLHLLTRPWLPQIYLITVIRKLHSLGFVLPPTTRDNLGFTILDQMKHLGTHLLGFDPDEDMKIRQALGLTCETKGYIIRPKSQNPVAKSTLTGNEYLRNYERNNFIETVEDLQR
jgi:hypothetical protein